ncbi:hypothetical protein Tco_0716159 [Tanacetum coccineum]
MKSNESMIRNMQTQINVLRGDFKKKEESLRRNLNNDMRSILGSFFKNQASTLGTLRSNTIPNLKGEMKAITTLSGVAYEGPSIPSNPSPKKVAEREMVETTDKEQTNFQGSTAHIQPLVIPILIPEPDVLKTLPKPNIPYPTRLNDPKAESSVKKGDKSNEKESQRRSLASSGKFSISYDLLSVDFDADPRVPLILGRSFLRTGRALIVVYEEEITLRVNDEAVTFTLNQTMRYSSTYDDISHPDLLSLYFLRLIPLSLTLFEGSDLILEEIEAYLKDDSILPEIDHADFDMEGDLRLIEELLNNDPSSPFPLSHNPLSSSTTSSSPSLIPVETSDALLEEFADELALLEPFPQEIVNDDFDPEGDILLLEKFLNDDPSSPLHPKELNFEKLKMIKYLIDDVRIMKKTWSPRVLFSIAKLVVRK